MLNITGRLCISCKIEATEQEKATVNSDLLSSLLSDANHLWNESIFPGELVANRVLPTTSHQVSIRKSTSLSEQNANIYIQRDA